MAHDVDTDNDGSTNHSMHHRCCHVVLGDEKVQNDFGHAISIFRERENPPIPSRYENLKLKEWHLDTTHGSAYV